MASRGGAAAFFRSKSDESSDNLPTSLPLSLSLLRRLRCLGKMFSSFAAAAAAALFSSFPRRPSDGRTAAAVGMNAEECVT